MKNITEYKQLAVNGGSKVRKHEMPAREAFGDCEFAALMKACEFYRLQCQDPPYQGHFEAKFCGEFVKFQGGKGFSDAVSSGTASCHIALAALDLPKGSDVMISPVTDSGPLNCIILQNYKPVLVDSAPNSFNIDVDQFLARITADTRAIMVVHSGGEPVQIDRIVEEAHRRGIKVIEDCSQAPGAALNGRKVGTFGDIAAFSTMYRKSLAAGASGGIVYTQDRDLYNRALAHADRGKQVWRTDINQNDPGHALLPALNFNTDEFSCAIGSASLARLQATIDARKDFVKNLVNLLQAETVTCRGFPFNEEMSPFFLPIFVDQDQLCCTKTEFANALRAEGIDLNDHYGCVVSDWDWARPYMADSFMAENATKTRDCSFNLFLNERYGEREIDDILKSIKKIEAYTLL